MANWLNKIAMLLFVGIVIVAYVLGTKTTPSYIVQENENSLNKPLVITYLPDITTPNPPLATSEDGKWILTAPKDAEVVLQSVASASAKAQSKAFVFSNPHQEKWDIQEHLPAQASRAVFSPKSQYAVILWTWRMVYSPEQLQLVNIKTQHSYFLPESDFHGAEDLKWDASDTYFASVSQDKNDLCVRLWNTHHPKQMKIFLAPKIKKLRLLKGYVDRFTNNDRQLKVLYSIYDDRTDSISEHYLRTIYSVPDGKLLSTKLQ